MNLSLISLFNVSILIVGGDEKESDYPTAMHKKIQ